MDASSSTIGRRALGNTGYAFTEILAETIAAGWLGLSRAIAAFAESRRRAQARRELHHLSDHTLKDIGLERCDIDGLFR
jgi:uncharacterized protein YjiS (DUF1127 family)